MKRSNLRFPEFHDSSKKSLNIIYAFLIFCAVKIEFSTAFAQSGFRPAAAVGSPKILDTTQHTRSNHQKVTKLYMSEEPPLTAFLDKLSKTGLDNTSIQRDSLVIAKYDVPDLGIFADQTYQLQSIYAQGMNKFTENKDGESSGIIDKIEQPFLDLAGKTNNIPSGYTLYITLYSQMYHDNDKFGGKAVITTPEEVGLVSMKDEVLDSVIVALPILSFWLATCFSFSNWYTSKYGGNFIDAFLRQ